jgi:hypothetical protein
MPRQNYTTLFCALLCAIVCCTWSSPVVAQQLAVAQVSGQVTDPSGAAVVDATIKMTETERAVVHTTATNSTGDYVLPGLPVGPYSLEISKQGFKTHRRSGMVLQVNDHVTLNVALQVGMATETVEVSGAEMLVQTESPAISSVIESQRIIELPLNGRMATQLVLYSGAAVDAPAGDEKGSKSFVSSQTYSVAGGQHNATNYLLDGADWNDAIFNVNMPFPIPDALQEFSVETSALPARNGIHPGGAVNAVTKSGANQIHGTLFEYYRSGNFNAARRNFGSGPQHDSLLRNQYGGTFGGKIIANKLFYFGAYQTTRAKSASTPASVKSATQAMLNGDFSAFDGVTCPKETLSAYPGNKIDPSKFDPASVKLFTGGYIPISTNPCGTISYSVPSIDNEDQAVGKIDWAKSNKHLMYFRYLLDDYRHPAPFDIHNLALTTGSGNWERAQGFTWGDTYTFSSAITNSFHFAFSRRRDNRGSDPRTPTLQDLGANMYTAIDHYMQVTMPSGYFQIGCGTCTDAHLNTNTWQFSDDVDWLKGKHHFAFGANFMRNQTNTQIGYLFNGSIAFDASSGDGIANLLLGAYSGFSQSNPQNVNYRVTLPSLYAQDTYKVRPSLTVTAGLRWEPTIWPHDIFHRGSQFSMENFINNVHSTVYPNAPAGTLYFGDSGVPAAFTNNHYRNFSPRIGIAWDPRGKGTSSLRMGYGILYDASMVWMSQRLTSNPPVTNEIDPTNGCGTMSKPWLNYSLASGCVTNSGTNQNPFPVAQLGTAASFPAESLYVSLPPNMKPMYMEQWNLSYEQQFLKDWAASIAYLGSRTLHIPTTIDANAPVANPALCASLGGCKTTNEAARRLLRLIYPTTDPRKPGLYGSLFMTDDSQFASYNAMLATIRHRFVHGLNFQANYTWSKCLSTGDFNGDLRTTTFMQQNNPRLDYGPCNMDMRQIFNSTLVAQSPVHGTGWKKWVLGGWQFAPGVRAYTGIAINVTNGSDQVLADVINLGRPELVSGQPLYLNQWLSGPLNCNGSKGWCYAVFNPAAFVAPNNLTAPPNATTANPYAYIPIQRDMLHAPGVFNVDASLSRSFPIREGKDIVFKFDMFNAFNHYNPTIGGQGLMSNATTTNKGFGLVTGPTNVGFLPSVYDPRILQFSMKLNF